MNQVALVVVLVLSADLTAAGGQDRPPLTVSSAAADEGSGTLTIEGSGFGPRPFVTHNPELLRLLTPHLDAELTHYVDARTTGDQVKGALKRVLAGRRPAMTDVAKELGLSTRTLQRRLNDEGVSFQQLLLDARRELARHYLMQPSLELTEAAYLLGYGDPNSFFRAFHEWEGTSPGVWRAQNLQPALERAG